MQTNEKHMLSPSEGNKLSSVSHPGVSCLLAESMNSNKLSCQLAGMVKSPRHFKKPDLQFFIPTYISKPFAMQFFSNFS